MISLTAYDPNSVWGKQQAAGLANIQGRFGQIRGQTQSTATNRGMGRSGFLGSQMNQLASDEDMATQAMDAQVAADKQGYDQQQAMIAEMQKQQRYGKKSKRRGRWGRIGGAALGMIGKAIGVAL